MLTVITSCDRSSPRRCEGGYTTDRDVAAAQVVLVRGLAAVGHTVSQP